MAIETLHEKFIHELGSINLLRDKAFTGCQFDAKGSHG